MADESASTTTDDKPEAKAEVKTEAKTETPTITPEDIKGKNPDEIVKFVSEQSEKFGVTKKQLQDYENYIKQVKPYIDVITENEELTKQVEAAYKKKFNIEESKKEEKKEEPRDDTRQAVENSIVNAFEISHGLDKVEGDVKKEMNVKIGQELMELLDPSGTKTYNEVIASVSLQKLPKYLEKAYNLATMGDTIKKIREEAQSGSTGVISSVPSSSTSDEATVLTPEERQAAKLMGVAEDKWLQRKKEIIARNEGR